MSQFLVDRYETVERLTSIRKSKEPNFSHKTQNKIQTYVSQENLTLSCKLCSGEHSLRECPKFRALTVQQRLDFVFRNKICNNCLAMSHMKVNCKSKHTCLHCRKNHHTLLHMGQKPSNLANVSETPQNAGSSSSQEKPLKESKKDSQNNKNYMNEPPSTSKKVYANCSTDSEHILLRTALVQVEHRGEKFTLRALIDPGSQRTFLSERIRSRLQLPYEKSNFEIIGIGGQRQSASKECELTLFAKRHNQRIIIRAIILPRVTKYLPSHTFQVPKSSEIADLDLADPTFNPYPVLKK